MFHHKWIKGSEISVLYVAFWCDLVFLYFIVYPLSILFCRHVCWILILVFVSGWKVEECRTPSKGKFWKNKTCLTLKVSISSFRYTLIYISYFSHTHTHTHTPTCMCVSYLVCFYLLAPTWDIHIRWFVPAQKKTLFTNYISS